ncbi:putative LPXTG-motif cell wall anchor domain protein [uncultured Eubacteriales bacterium]|uniref:Putative LPXTG-motif cell wall anchor domain protein n=1 Tax=uncultured Eubacteriales bacterium TaxID=172733 RepID=A0A212IWS7_9FIRM|nr:putative LPXTG-motif cell wall anchor domain protein [uncultured Eubacteriales bacterium]
MKKSLAVQVKDFIENHDRRRRLLALICALSIFTSLGVYGALMRPAISMEKSNPLLTAETPNAVFGDELTAQITATASTDLDETYFYLSTKAENAALTAVLSFDADGVASVPTHDGGDLELHRVEKAGNIGYWFTLVRGHTASFDLPYSSTQIEYTVGVLPEEATPLAAEPDKTDYSEPFTEAVTTEPTASEADAPTEDVTPIETEPAEGPSPVDAAPTDETASPPVATAPVDEPDSTAPTTETIYEDPDTASVQLYAAAGASLEGARAAAEENRGEETPTLILTWMTLAELDAASGTDPAEPPVLLPEIPEMPEGATSWATVERIEDDETPAARSFGLMAASQDLLAAAGPVDFGQYITGATVSKLQNGSWTPATEFADGDKVKVAITYTLPANTVGANNKIITYNLPTGVLPGKEESGLVYEGTTPVGTYTITPEGQITITFNDSFADDKAFNGTIQLQGSVSAGENGTENNISFGSSTSTIKVSVPAAATDLVVSKTGSYTASSGKLTYKVIASTTKGTAGTVTITDKFQSGNTSATYTTNSFSIYKVSANGTRSKVNTTPSVSGQQFTVSNLPQLSAGESYEISYTATPGTTTDKNGASYVSNGASATSGSNTGSDWEGVEVAKQMLTKTGSYDEGTGKIKWTITINPSKLNISGYKLADALTASTGITQTLPASAEIKNSAGTAVGTITNWANYLFPSNSKDTYTIEYLTDAPTGTPGTTTTVTNKLDMTKGSSSSYTTSIDVGVPHKNYGVTKRAGGSSSAGIYNWTGEITVPATGLALDKVLYTDTIGNATLDGATVPGTHYTTAELLNKLTVVARKGSTQTTLIYGTDYEIQDASGNKITNFSSTTHLQGFKVVFLSSSAAKIAGTTSTLSYSTYIDYGAALGGETYVFSNMGAIPGLTSTATYTYTAPRALEKQASADGVIAWNKDYTSAPLAVDFDTADGVIYYRLLLNLSDFTGNEITVTDFLPSGAALAVPTDGTPAVTAKLYGNKDWQVSSFNYGQANGDPAGTYVMNDHVKATVETDGTMKIVIDKVDKIRIGYHGVPSPITVAVYYQLSVAADPNWSDLGNKSQIYWNRATWNGSTDEQKTTVNREVPNVGKTGEQLPMTDENGNVMYELDGVTPKWTDTIRYHIIINPAGLDLATGADTITMTDVLTTRAGASLLLDSVKLYRYDASKPNGQGTLISRDQYKVSYNDLTYTATFVLPDSTPVILYYDYFIERGKLADVTVSNTATLQGNALESGTSSIKLKESSSSATANKKTITIYKVDSSDFSKLLPGAVFKLEQYTQSGGTWAWRTVDNGVYTTDENGKILLDFMDDKHSLANNVLYRLAETTAPAGYQASSTPYYFVWMADNKDKTETISAMTQTGFAGVDTSLVRFVTSSGTSIYVPNEYTAIGVKKLWRDDKGETLTSPPAASVELELWRQARKVDGYTVTVNVTTANSSFSASQMVAMGSSLTIAVNAWWPSTYSVTIAGQTSTVNQSGGRAVLASLSNVSSNMTVAVNITDYLSSLPFEFSGYTNPTSMVEAGTAELVTDTPIILNAANGWAWLSASLKKTDTSGNAYYYWVKEKVPSGSTVTYLNNSGIRTGDITVTNTVSSFTLPNTGGTGLLPFYLLGGLTMAAAASAALLLFKKRRSEGGRS